jgi:hypothetical protein
MRPTSYTENTIFENPQVNALCDLLFIKLVAQFPPEGLDSNNYYIYKGIILSGNGAKIMNGETATNLKNIVFECDKLTVFQFLTANIHKIFPGKSIKFKNRILAYPFDDYYFEIWYNPTLNKEILNSGIYVQQTAFINPETL